jgi:hypothetical protein
MKPEFQTMLEQDYYVWVVSNDGTRVVAYKWGAEKAIIFDTRTAEEIAVIYGEFERFAWSPDDTKVMGTDFRTTNVFDGFTGKRLYGVEATY